MSAHFGTVWQGGVVTAAVGSRSLAGHHALHKHSKRFARLSSGCFAWPLCNGIGGGIRTDICIGVLAQQVPALQQRQAVDHSPVSMG